jgi:hypothetical protein
VGAVPLVPPYLPSGPGAASGRLPSGLHCEGSLASRRPNLIEARIGTTGEMVRGTARLDDTREGLHSNNMETSETYRTGIVGPPAFSIARFDASWNRSAYEIAGTAFLMGSSRPIALDKPALAPC